MVGRPPPDEEATKEMIMKQWVCCVADQDACLIVLPSVRVAPPLSMWDAPESGDYGFNRFARREHTKAARAAEYWSSDFDEYALPDSNSRHASDFGSARMSKRSKISNPSAPQPPRPPSVKLLPSNHNHPAPLPFTFGAGNQERRQANIGLFTNNNSSSLAMMRSLGLPGEDAPITSSSPDVSPQPPTMSTFASAAMSSISDWKNLGAPDVDESNGAASVPLAKGTKRLGMGRPVPWDASSKPPRPA